MTLRRQSIGSGRGGGGGGPAATAAVEVLPVEASAGCGPGLVGEGGIGSGGGGRLGGGGEGGGGEGGGGLGGGGGGGLFGGGGGGREAQYAEPKQPGQFTTQMRSGPCTLPTDAPKAAKSTAGLTDARLSVRKLPFASAATNSGASTVRTEAL